MSISVQTFGKICNKSAGLMEKAERDWAGEMFRYSIRACCLLSRVYKPCDCNILSCCFISVWNFVSLSPKEGYSSRTFSARTLKKKCLNPRESDRRNTIKSFIICIIQLGQSDEGDWYGGKCVTRIRNWEICTRIESEYLKKRDLLGHGSIRGRILWRNGVNSLPALKRHITLLAS